MKSTVVKRSIVVAAHKTSTSLEDAFWEGLKDIAKAGQVTLSDLVGGIDADRARIMAREHAVKCPNCKALYELVRVEAGPETSNGEPTCQVCGGPLTAREGKFVLKYFLLRQAVRRRRQGRAKAV
jgi:hypothetical protein